MTLLPCAHCSGVANSKDTREWKNPYSCWIECGYCGARSAVWGSHLQAAQSWNTRAAAAVPEGFVVVPVVPTPKMIDATWDHDDDIQSMSSNARNALIYRAMIEAAQEQGNGNH